MDATLLQEKIGTEETVPIYDKGGNQVDALVSSVDIDKGTAEVTVEDEVIQLPLDSYPNQDGFSFASNESLYSPGRYTVNGRELGQLKDEELRQLSFDIALTDDLKQQVANGEISQAEANEQTDLTRLNARQQYDLAAIGEELKRRGFEVESSSPDVEQDLKAANQQKQIDSGEYSDNIDKNLGEIGKGTLYDTYFDTDAPTKGAVDDLTQARKDKALKDIEESTDLNDLFDRFNLTPAERLEAISKAIGVERVDELRKGKGKKKVKAEDLIEGLTPLENANVIQQAASIKTARKLNWLITIVQRH